MILPGPAIVVIPLVVAGLLVILSLGDDPGAGGGNGPITTRRAGPAPGGTQRPGAAAVPAGHPPVRDGQFEFLPGRPVCGRREVGSGYSADKPVTRYFLMSRTYKASEVLRIVRAHWDIENGLHWSLDVVLDEDLARNRKDNGPANLAMLRRLALNVARAHPDTTTSLRLKLKRAGWNDNFLLELVAHMR